MVKNVIEQNITPQVPNSIPNEHIVVYVPIATNNTPGIARFYDKHFILVNGVVKINPEYIKGLSLDDYQKKTDENLDTVDKTIAGAINEINQNANHAEVLADAAITTADNARLLAEQANTLITKKPTVYFESEFKQIYYTLKYSAEMDSSNPDKIKKGDIFILTEESQPDFVVLDDGGYVFNDAITVRDGYIPSPEVGKKYFIADTYTVIAIESGVQKPAIDSALNANSTNPLQNKVITAVFTTVSNKFVEIEQKLTKVSGKSNVLLYTIDNEIDISNFIYTFLQDNYDNLNSGDILVVRYYYEEYYKDYIYILRQESPMVRKTWHLLTVYDTGATSGGTQVQILTWEVTD